MIHNIVKIDYDIRKGLLLKWNFKNLKTTIYFRHIVILDVDKSFAVLDFINSYYSKIKPGDMINFVLSNFNRSLFFSGWKEKNSLTKI